MLPNRLLTGNLDALARLDPHKIYVENVRSVFNISHPAAVRFCDTAVRQGVFQKFVEVACPDGSVPASAPRLDLLPERVRCYVETDGFVEEVEFATADLQKTVFYRLIDAPDDTAHAHASPA